MPDRHDRPGQPWHLYILGLLAAGVVAFAITQIGPPTSSARTSQETVTAEEGVVQTTVSGTGNVEAGTDVDANFQSSGTLATVLVHVGQHVTDGQLLATLDPTEAQLALDQAQENLTAAQDQLTTLEDGGTTSGPGSTSTGSATNASTTVNSGTTEFVSATVAAVRPKTKPGKTQTTPRSSTPTRPTTTPTRTTTTPTPTTTTPTRTTTTNTTTTPTPSPSSIASAQANVDSAESNLRSAEDALGKLQLHAPATGTIVSMAGLAIGDTVSAGSSGAASSGSGSGGSGSNGTSGGGGSGGSTTAGGLGSSSSSSSGSSNTSFAEIVDTGTMTMTVAFSESDITQVKVGQPATVTMDALSGVELGAHVSSISTVGSSSSGVVSYDATLTLDQLDPRVKPGMSASASVITGQAEGVTLPTQAIAGTGSLASVTVKNGTRTVQQQVVVGLRGSSRAQIVSGLKAGQQVVITITLPSLSSSSSGAGTGGLGGRLGGGLGGLGGLGGGGGGAFFRRAAGG